MPFYRHRLVDRPTMPISFSKRSARKYPSMRVSPMRSIQLVVVLAAEAQSPLTLDLLRTTLTGAQASTMTIDLFDPGPVRSRQLSMRQANVPPGFIRPYLGSAGCNQASSNRELLRCFPLRLLVCRSLFASLTRSGSDESATRDSTRPAIGVLTCDASPPAAGFHPHPRGNTRVQRVPLRLRGYRTLVTPSQCC